MATSCAEAAPARIAAETPGAPAPRTARPAPGTAGAVDQVGLTEIMMDSSVHGGHGAPGSAVRGREMSRSGEFGALEVRSTKERKE